MTTETAAEDRLAALAQPFTFSQANATGITRDLFRLLLAEGRVRHVLREVYVRNDLPDTIEMKASAIALVAPAHAVICDRTAAWLWGVDAFRHWELDMLPPLDTYVLRGNSRIRRPETCGGERDLRCDDVVVIGGMRVTTPLRTSLDLGCRLSRYEALAVMDSFARLHDVGPAELRALLPRYRRRRGVVQARELVRLVDPRSESAAESFVRLVIHDHGLPAPEPQYWVTVGGVAAYRLDLAYPRLRIGVEYDGEDFHSSEEDRGRDRRRRTWLRDNGWLVIVVRKDDLRGASREAWLHELRTALAARQQ